MINEHTETFLGKDQFIWWQGVVEDNLDPLKLGRLRVRILGFHSSNKIDIPTEHLPWASVIQSINSASMNGIGNSPTGILKGTWVVGFFRDGTSGQDPIVFGSIGGIPQEKSQPAFGFNDPDGIYPKEDFLKEPDTNRLSRNENIEKTIIQTKKDNVITDINTALKVETWAEPKTEYSSVYPKNHVKETESGHIEEFDDTPGKERIHLYHKSGTFKEIFPDGSEVVKIVGKSYEIVISDNKILIKGSKSETINGNNNILVNNDMNIEVLGSANILVHGNVIQETTGNYLHKVNGSYKVVADGKMSFVSTRIDLNPSGENPVDTSNPLS